MELLRACVPLGLCGQYFSANGYRVRDSSLLSEWKPRPQIIQPERGATKPRTCMAQRHFGHASTGLGFSSAAAMQTRSAS